MAHPAHSGSISRSPSSSPRRDRPTSPRRSLSPQSDSISRSPAHRRNGSRPSLSHSPPRGRSLTRSPARGRSRSYSRGPSYSRSYSRSNSRPSPSQRNTKIVVEKLTKNVNSDHLREIFGHYGSIQVLDLPMNQQFNTNRGTAYIIYNTVSAAESAVSHMHEAQLDGAVISVSIVLPKRRFSHSPPARSDAYRGRDGYQYNAGPQQHYAGRRQPPQGQYHQPSRYRASPGPPIRRRSRSPARGYSGRGRNDAYYRQRSYSRSRSPVRRSRSRSRGYSSQSSRSPPLRGGRVGANYRRNASPRHPGPSRRRSPSYGSHYSHRSRTRSHSRDRAPRRR